jgi:predicted PurR-regulated permease PerM
MGNFDKFINLKSNGSSNMTIITALLIFYMFVTRKFISDIYSGQLTDYITNNRWIKHLIGYITMLLIIVQAGNINSGMRAIIYSIVGYSWFILTTKLDIHWNLAIIGLLVIGFMYEKQMFQKELESSEDEALKDKHRKRIRASNKSMKRLIVGSIILITLVGSYIYYNKKQLQYGGNFDNGLFLFGGRNK